MTYKILINIRCPLPNPHLLHTPHQGPGRRLLNIPIVARDLRHDSHRQSIGEITRAGRVKQGFVRTCSVCRDDVEGSGHEAAGADLGEGVTGEGHGFGGAACDGVCACLEYTIS
jgi:hypothetical protein